jgi:hypothetical protein
MRIPKNFGVKTAEPSESLEPKKKYFLVFEGEETEVQYFNGVIDNRDDIGINSLIELKPLLRSYNEKGWSNPKKILNRLIKYFEESKMGTLTVNSFVDRIIDYLIEDRVITEGSVYTAESMREILIEYCQKEMGLSREEVISDETLATNSVCLCLEDSMNLLYAAENIIKYINEQKITYEEGFDKICLIADRDGQSFKPDQFDFVVETCNLKGYSFYLSTPCFELWLLMHFDEIMKYDRGQLLKNLYVTKDKRFIAKELALYLQGYKKENVRFDGLKGRINKAIQNEKHFCEDIIKLKNELGSNIGLLFEELMFLHD